MSFAPRRSISSASACEAGCECESLITRTFTPACFAAMSHSRAAMSWLVDPLPAAFRNFTGKIVVLQFTPVTPIPLLPTAPIIPAMCVP